MQEAADTGGMLTQNVSEQGWATLLGDKFINDEVVMTMLRNHVSEHTTVMDTNFVLFLYDAAGNRSRTVSKPRRRKKRGEYRFDAFLQRHTLPLRSKLLTTEYVLIPVNVSNLHWYLIAIDMKTPHVHIYDPLEAQETIETKTHPETLIQWICDELELMNMEAEAEADSGQRTADTQALMESWTGDVPVSYHANDQLDGPKQHESNDCGLFLIRTGLWHVTGRKQDEMPEQVRGILYAPPPPPLLLL